MRLLIDSHAAIWALVEPGRLKPAAAQAIVDGANEVWFSLVTIWELSVKFGLGRLSFDPKELHDGCLEIGFRLLPLTLDHALAIRTIPHHHRDPFDRMIIAQAQVEGLTIVTHDEAFRSYGVPVLWA